MITWHIGKKIEVVDTTEKEKSCEFQDDLKKSVIIKYYNGTEKGTEEHDIDVFMYADSAIGLSTDNSFIYFYPEQVAELKKLLMEN